jgi:aryl-alcohol dehydrogenase-like predicted oxidoreductase
MEQRALGASGLHVSRLGLGTMTWGRDTDEHEARDQWKAFLDAGGTLIDTADVYAEGLSERLIGTFLNETGTRDQVVLATKAGSRPRTTRRFDTSRGHLLRALDGSLARLGTDHVDLWLLHAWDARTPVEETLSAVDLALSSGRVRYVGVSNVAGWQLGTMAALQRQLGPALVAAQMEYSLVQRGIEAEVVPAAKHHGIGLLAWSPLGRGVLTGKYRYGVPADSRAASPHFGPFVSEYLGDAHRRVVEAVATAAEGLDVSPLEVSLAWVRDRPGVVAPVVGARTHAQLLPALDAEELVLPAEITAALDEVSAPALTYPAAGWNQRG